MLHRRAAHGDQAQRVVADVPRGIRPHQVQRGTAEVRKGAHQGGAIRRGVHAEKGRVHARGIVGRPGQRQRPSFAGIECRDHGRFHLARPTRVLGRQHIQRCVQPATDTDGLGMVDGQRPGAVGALVLGAVARAAQVFHAQILDIGAQVGHAPGDVRVTAHDHEGHAGQREAGHVEPCGTCMRAQAATICARQSRMQRCFVPDVWNGQAQVHVVGDHGRARGCVGPAHGPVV